MDRSSSSSKHARIVAGSFSLPRYWPISLILALASSYSPSHSAWDANKSSSFQRCCAGISERLGSSLIVSLLIVLKACLLLSGDGFHPDTTIAASSIDEKTITEKRIHSHPFEISVFRLVWPC